MQLLNAAMTASAVMLAAGSFTAPAARGAMGADSTTVERFLRSAQPPLVSYVAMRHLEASTRGGATHATLDARTELRPDGTFFYDVVREGGSDLIRGHVLRKAIEEERRARQQRELGAAELVPANYEFGEANEVNGLVRIPLTPRRQSQMLIVGHVLVSHDDGDLRRVEGLLSKRPSFWTREVRVSREYTRVNGVRVPAAMRSTADVRIVGASSFEMTYRYQAVNGAEVESTKP